MKKLSVLKSKKIVWVLAIFTSVGSFLAWQMYLSEAVSATINSAIEQEYLLRNELQKITASDGLADDFFGTSTAIDGDTIIIGASGDDIVSNSGQGSAYIYVKTGNTWIQQAKLTANDGAAGDAFGDSVAIDGDTVIIGA